MLPATVRQDCQPPVPPTAIEPTGALPRLSSRTSIRPEMPPPAPEAIRTENCVAAVEPKSTLEKPSQSPLAIQPTLRPPSVLSWLLVPDWASKPTASIRDRAD